MCFREALELPELAGTWVLNEKMYVADIPSDVYLNGTIAMKTREGTIIRTTTKLRLTKAVGEPGFYYLDPKTTNRYETIYLFNRAEPWYDNTRILDISNVTQCDEFFYAWLASNATKQS